MTAFQTLDALSPARRIVTIGAFDGVHRGHAHLLNETVRRARELRYVSTAVTFEPLPVQVLSPARFAGRICPPQDKLTHMAGSGIDEIVTITFDHDLSRQTPEEFLGALVDATGMRELRVERRLRLAATVGRYRQNRRDRPGPGVPCDRRPPARRRRPGHQ